MRPPPDPAISRTLSSILGAPEFQAKPSDWVTERLERLLRALGHWLRALTPGQRWALLTLSGLALAAIVAHVVWTLVSAGRGAATRAPRVGSLAQAPIDPAAVRALAQRLAGEGRLREAARALHQALLLELARRRGLARRSELSDWEWVALLPADERLSEFTRVAQSVAYGPRAERRELEACERLFAELAAA
ncbi:MAG: hypothetical protein ACYCWW_18130 [Deltaproteobacteria bacterium]